MAKSAGEKFREARDAVAAEAAAAATASAADASAAAMKHLDQFYTDARDRANSAERIMSEAIRGTVLLNGGAIALALSGLGWGKDGGLGLKAYPTVASDVLAMFVTGALFGIGAVGAFAISSFGRSYFEFEEAERLYFADKEARLHEALSWLWRGVYLIGAIAALICGILAMVAFYMGAFSSTAALRSGRRGPVEILTWASPATLIIISIGVLLGLAVVLLLVAWWVRRMTRPSQNPQQTTLSDCAKEWCRSATGSLRSAFVRASKFTSRQ